MEENHVTGSAKTTGGKVKEDFRRIARDAQAQIKGQGEQVQRADMSSCRQAIQGPNARGERASRPAGPVDARSDVAR
jgi:hypothetical protein